MSKHDERECQWCWGTIHPDDLHGWREIYDGSIRCEHSPNHLHEPEEDLT